MLSALYLIKYLVDMLTCLQFEYIVKFQFRVFKIMPITNVSSFMDMPDEVSVFLVMTSGCLGSFCMCLFLV